MIKFLLGFLLAIILIPVFILFSAIIELDKLQRTNLEMRLLLDSIETLKKQRRLLRIKAIWLGLTYSERVRKEGIEVALIIRNARLNKIQK